MRIKYENESIKNRPRVVMYRLTGNPRHGITSNAVTYTLQTPWADYFNITSHCMRIERYPSTKLNFRCSIDVSLQVGMTGDRKSLSIRLHSRIVA